ncbi:MAG: Glycerophosphoryl diester phosphodiesterase, partial [uncultured Nocardioides sp.]
AALHEAAGRGASGREPRQPRAHPRCLPACARGRRGRPRVRRQAHRRRPPDLRARPRPAAHGGEQGRRLHDAPRRPRRARLRLVEEPLRRLRRRGARPRRAPRQGAHPAHAARDRGRLRPARGGGDRDQAPGAVRRPRRAAARGDAARLRLGPRRLARAGDELLLPRPAAHPPARARDGRRDAHRQEPPLAGAQARGGRRLDPGAGHGRAAGEPVLRGQDGQEQAAGARVDRQHRRRPAPVPGPRGASRHQRPPGLHAGAARQI